MQNSHSLLGLVHRTLHKFENSGVPRISRDSITGSDMPSALGLVPIEILTQLQSSESGAVSSREFAFREVKAAPNGCRRGKWLSEPNQSILTSCLRVTFALLLESTCPVLTASLMTKSSLSFFLPIDAS